MPEGMCGQHVAALPMPVNWRLPCVYPHNTKFSGHMTLGTRPYKISRAWGRGYNYIDWVALGFKVYVNVGF